MNILEELRKNELIALPKNFTESKIDDLIQTINDLLQTSKIRESEDVEDQIYFVSIQDEMFSLIDVLRFHKRIIQMKSQGALVV